MPIIEDVDCKCCPGCYTGCCPCQREWGRLIATASSACCTGIVGEEVELAPTVNLPNTVWSGEKILGCGETWQLQLHCTVSLQEVTTKEQCTDFYLDYQIPDAGFVCAATGDPMQFCFYDPNNNANKATETGCTCKPLSLTFCQSFDLVGCCCCSGVSPPCEICWTVTQAPAVILAADKFARADSTSLGTTDGTGHITTQFSDLNSSFPKEGKRVQWQTNDASAQIIDGKMSGLMDNTSYEYFKPQLTMAETGLYAFARVEKTSGNPDIGIAFKKQSDGNWIYGYVDYNNNKLSFAELASETGGLLTAISSGTYSSPPTSAKYYFSYEQSGVSPNSGTFTIYVEDTGGGNSQVSTYNETGIGAITDIAIINRAAVSNDGAWYDDFFVSTYKSTGWLP